MSHIATRKTEQALAEQAKALAEQQRQRVHALIRENVLTLKRSDRGREVLKGLDVLLDSAVGLDCFGRESVLFLIRAAFSPHTGATLDAVRNALESR